jgi:hypothetical protein
LNKIDDGAPWLAGAAGLTLVVAVADGLRLPPVLSGPNLRVALGNTPDPHLLTAAIERLLMQHCALNAPCVHYWNVAVLALAVLIAGGLAVFAARTNVRGIALLATGAVALSPLVAPLALDPLGIGMTVTVALVALAAIDATGIVAFPTVVRCVLGAAIALQDPLLAPAALVYAAIAAVRARSIARYAPLACAVIAIGLRLPTILHSALDPLAGPPTIVIIGVCLFVLGPLVIVLVRRDALAAIGAQASTLTPGLALGAAAFLGGAFCTTGDPAPYWLAGEVAIVVALYKPALAHTSEPKRLTRLLVLFGVAFALQFWTFAEHHGDNTSVILAHQSDTLRSFLNQGSNDRCVVTDVPGRHYILVDGWFVHTYGARAKARVVDDAKNCLDLPGTATLASIDGLYVTDLGASMALLHAQQGAASGTVLAIQDGDVSPKTIVKTPTGTGEFGNNLATPLGPLGDFTVLSGFRYTPRCVRVRASEHLTFVVSAIPGSPNLGLSVSVRKGNVTRALYDRVLVSPLAGAPYAWQRVSIPLEPSACAAFTFAVAQPGDAKFHYWVTFAGATVR